MVDITHYEVYTDRGNGWKLEERFPAEQRLNAVKYARDKESENISVKLICEKFDVLDNSYQESTEFVSLAQKKKNKKSAGLKGGGENGGKTSSENSKTIYDAEEEQNNSLMSVLKALAKLLLIVLFSLMFAHFVVSLGTPLLEENLSEESSKNWLFLSFFFLFLLTATPLILKKIPWGVFGFSRPKKTQELPERKLIKKARNLFRLYNLNEGLEPGVVPSYPEADLEDKHYIIEFLGHIIANLGSTISLNDGFNRFGVKLVIFGGCMELARCRRLNIAQANSLLNEAFNILDDKNYEVAEFYEAKRSYRDNRVAVFLTGVGAYLMAQLINGETLNKHVLRLTFEKWQEQNVLQRGDQPAPAAVKPAIPSAPPAEPEKKELPVYKGCLLNIYTRILFNEADPANDEKKEEEIKSALANILTDLQRVYNGLESVKSETFETIPFVNIKQAIRCAADFLKDTEAYVEKLNDENLIIAHKLNLIEGKTEELPEKENYIKDLFDNTYDGEIITDETFYKSVGESNWKFDFLGEKSMERSGSTIPLYKLMDN